MFKVVLDGVVEELIRATIVADPEFASIKPKGLKQKALFDDLGERG